MTLRDDFEQTYRSLSRLDLQQGAHGLEEIGVEDLFGSSSELFLGYYSEDGLKKGLERYGLFSELDANGFPDTRLEISIKNEDEHLLRVWNVHNAHTPLIELVVRRGTIQPSAELAARIDTQFLNVLDIEWLQMQNPKAKFSPDRPPLPGQQYPGLGLGLQVMELLRMACHRLQLDGLATMPSYFHNALFYSEEFLYFDPHVQGVFLATVRDVLPQAFASPAAASWAFVWSMVQEVQEPELAFPWFHDAQVAPISDRLTAYLQDDAYNKEVVKTLSTNAFRVLAPALRDQLAAKGIWPFDADLIDRWVHDPEG